MFIASSKGLLKFTNGKITEVYDGHVHNFAVAENDILYCASRQNPNMLLKLCPLTGTVVKSIVLPIQRINHVVFYYDMFYNLCLGVIDDLNHLYVYKVAYNGALDEKYQSKEVLDVDKNYILQVFYRDSFWYIVHVSDKKTFCSNFDATFKKVKQDIIFNDIVSNVCLKGQNLYFSAHNTLFKFNLIYKHCTKYFECHSHIDTFTLLYPSRLIVTFAAFDNHKICMYDEYSLLEKEAICIHDTVVFDVWDFNDYRTTAIGGSTYVQCIPSTRLQSVLCSSNDDSHVFLKPNLEKEMKTNLDSDIGFVVTLESREDDFDLMRMNLKKADTTSKMVGKLRKCYCEDSLLWSHCRDFSSIIKKKRTVYQTNIVVEGEDSYFLYIHPKTREVVCVPNIPSTTKVFSIPVSTLFWHTNVCSNNSIVCYRNTYEPMLHERLMK